MHSQPLWTQNKNLVIKEKTTNWLTRKLLQKKKQVSWFEIKYSI